MQMQGTDLWTSGEEGGMNWEASIDMYAPPCVKQLWEAAVQTGGSAQRSRSSPMEGWHGGEGSPRWKGCTHPAGSFTVYQKLTQHCKAIICCCAITLHVQLFATLWTTAGQASLFFTISWSLLKLRSIESVMQLYSNNLKKNPLR